MMPLFGQSITYKNAYLPENYLVGFSKKPTELKLAIVENGSQCENFFVFFFLRTAIQSQSLTLKK